MDALMRLTWIRNMHKGAACTYGCLMAGLVLFAFFAVQQEGTGEVKQQQNHRELQISSVMRQAGITWNIGGPRRARPRSTSRSRKAFCLTHVQRKLQSMSCEKLLTRGMAAVGSFILGRSPSDGLIQS